MLPSINLDHESCLQKEKKEKKLAQKLLPAKNIYQKFSAACETYVPEVDVNEVRATTTAQRR
jgi:hypothetical protein